jgi:hypothetical protein
MYLVAFKTDGVFYWVFLDEDPFPGCLPLSVIENVTYSHPEDILAWWARPLIPNVTFGRSRSQPQHFKLFPTKQALAEEGFDPLEGFPWLHRNWQSFLNSPQGRLAVRRALKDGRGENSLSVGK